MSDNGPLLLSPAELLTRAALLAGEGGEARHVGRQLALALDESGQRSCLDGGGRLQLTVDTPGSRGLRVSLATGPHLPVEPLRELCREADLLDLAALCREVGATEGWTTWSRAGVEWTADLRGLPDPLSRLSALGLPPPPRPPRSTPWALRLRVREGKLDRAEVHWLIDRHAAVGPILDELSPGGSAAATAAFRPLLGPLLGWVRWVVSTQALPGPQPLTVGVSRWSLILEDAQKHATIGAVVSEGGGPSSYAQALWSLLRGVAPPRWKVGRGLQLRISPEGGSRLRLILVPAVSGGQPGGQPEAAPR